MSGNPQPPIPNAKWREDRFLGNALVILGAVLIPNLLRKIIDLPISWGNVVGIAVAGALAYLLLPEPRKNVSRFALVMLGACVLSWFVGDVFEK